MTKTAVRRTLAFVLIILFISLVTGCWNRRELNTLGILGAVAVDLEGEKYKATFEFIKPKPIGSKGGGEEKKESVDIVQATGDSSFDAFRNATLKFERKVFIPHAKVYLFSEEVARKGMIDFIDFFQRDHETRRSTYVVIAKGSSAAEILNTPGGIENIPSNYMKRLLDDYRFNSKALATRLLDLLKYYYDKGKQPTIGIIYKNEKPKEITLKKSETEYELSTEGAAMFLEEKLVGFLDGPETRALNFVTGKAKSGVLVSPSPGGKGSNTVELMKSGSKNDVEIQGGKAKINVKVSITGMLGEEKAKIDLKDSAVIEKIEKANSEVVKQEIETTIRKVQQEYKTDIFGFGQTVHRKYPREWQKIQDDWNDIFSSAEVKVEVETKIARTGLTSTPVNKKEE